jgi:phage terminase small subunit
MKPFYVYMLVDPRDMLPFYIGKGTANRKNAHTHRVPKPKDGEKSPKAERIRAILEADLEVGSTILKRFEKEADALAFEKATIERLGLDKLTNSNIGGGGDTSKKKLSAKQEKFIAAFNVHGDATKAAKEAGYSEKTAHQIGYENLRKPEIAERITFAQEQFRERCEVTKESIAAELDENREMALLTFQPGAANASSMGKAKLYGLLVEKQEVTVTDGLADRVRRAKERAAKAGTE